MYSISVKHGETYSPPGASLRQGSRITRDREMSVIGFLHRWRSLSRTKISLRQDHLDSRIISADGRLDASYLIGYTSSRHCWRRSRLVAEGGGLLNRYRGLNSYRGFESLLLRHQTRRAGFRAGSFVSSFTADANLHHSQSNDCTHSSAPDCETLLSPEPSCCKSSRSRSSAGICIPPDQCLDAGTRLALQRARGNQQC